MQLSELFFNAVRPDNMSSAQITQVLKAGSYLIAQTRSKDLEIKVLQNYIDRLEKINDKLIAAGNI